MVNASISWVELMARVRRRLAEYRQTIEHEPSPEPETED